jgi:hypothetical protein
MRLLRGHQLLPDTISERRVGDAAPDFVQFPQASFTLLREMVSEGAWRQRTFPRQVFHSHVHIVDAAEDALDLMKSFGKFGGVGSEHGREEFREVAGLAQRNAQFVQLFRRGRTPEPLVLPSTA